MNKFNSTNLREFLNSPAATTSGNVVTIVGVVKPTTDDMVQFSDDNCATWLNLPITLIEEATHLGAVSTGQTNERYPLFSLLLTVPTGEAERFLFDLLSRTTRALSLARQSARPDVGCSCDKPSGPRTLSGCHACSLQYRCYRPCYNNDGSTYWGYDPVCC